MATLEKGGNAFDAACATAFTLQVVEPHLNGPGGDVPVIVHDVRRGKIEVICGQGPAPAGATIAHYRDELGLDLIPGTGLLAACVPGMFDTWMTAAARLRHHASLPTCCRRRSATPKTATRWSSASAPPSTRSRTSSATIGQRRPRFICRAVKCPARHHLPPTETMAETYERILREAQSGGGNARSGNRARA